MSLNRVELLTEADSVVKKIEHVD
uniref:Uncharacterized protein n=1 Tax=Arundo donax TaxID=35708 RepID=A0A0A9BHL4_ARUDO